MMAMELVIAFFTAEQRFDFIQLQFGVFHERAVLFYDVKTEPDVVAAVAGKRVAADFDKRDAFGFLRDSLFFNGLDDGLDEMNFVHNSFADDIDLSNQWNLTPPTRLRTTKIAGHQAFFACSKAASD